MKTLAPEELRDEAYKLLAKDRERLAGLNYPAYKGQTVSPMSALTQRARELRSEFASKPAPYSAKIEKVATRNANSFSPERIAAQLQMLQGGQQQFNQDKILGTLQQQFREAYNPRIARFHAKREKDTSAGLNELRGGLENIGAASNTLGQKGNQRLADALRTLQAQKENRGESLIGNLEQFGAQQHGYTNLKNQIAKNLFEKEARTPYERMNMLQQALEPLKGDFGMEVHPDVQGMHAQDAIKALRAYGIDPSKPVNQWDSSRTTPSTYQGKMVADLPPEILASQNVLARLDPKFQDVLYNQRKALMGQLVEDEDIGAKALNEAPTKMQPYIASLEDAAKKRLKQDMAAINNKYIQANQYGSAQHIKEADKRARQISKATLEERNKLLLNTLKEQLSLGHEGQIGNIGQLGLYGSLGHKEFGDVLRNIRGVNELGATKWANEQGENEELYKNYQNESLWQWPHMRTQARMEAARDIFGDLADRNISLDNLANLNTRYSELEKELAKYKQEPAITTSAAARKALEDQTKKSHAQPVSLAYQKAVWMTQNPGKPLPPHLRGSTQQTATSSATTIQPTAPKGMAAYFAGSLPPAAPDPLAGLNEQQRIAVNVAGIGYLPTFNQKTYGDPNYRGANVFQ